MLFLETSVPSKMESSRLERVQIGWFGLSPSICTKIDTYIATKPLWFTGETLIAAYRGNQTDKVGVILIGNIFDIQGF